jgi:hypothetical protein
LRRQKTWRNRFVTRGRLIIATSRSGANVAGQQKGSRAGGIGKTECVYVWRQVVGVSGHVTVLETIVVFLVLLLLLLPHGYCSCSTWICCCVSDILSQIYELEQSQPARSSI